MSLIKDFCLHNNTNEETVNCILNKNKRTQDYLLCKCGKIKPLYYIKGKYPAVKSYCGKTECSPNYGIKKPAHSIKMKELALSGKNSSNWKKGRVNTFVNTDQWKIKVLTNKGFNISEDIDVKKQYSEYLSNRIKKREHREKEVINFFHKHNLFDYDYFTNIKANTMKYIVPIVVDRKNSKELY